MTLEHVFQQIARKNDLTHVSFNMSCNVSEAYRFSVTVHWDGFSQSGNPCQSGNGATFEAALEDSLKNARRERGEEPNIDLSGLLRIAA